MLQATMPTSLLFFNSFLPAYISSIVFYLFPFSHRFNIRGMPRNLKGGRRNLKPSVFRPKSSEEQKKVNTSANVQFSAQSQAKSKKKSSRPEIVLHTYITFTPRKFFAFVCGGEGAAPDAKYDEINNTWICP